jgi:hypothetical protein
MIRRVALVILGLLAISIASVLALAATKPDTFRVARSISIKAPPEQIFPLINDLNRQLTWIPFDKDPAAKRAFGTIAAGKGAFYAWDGNSDVGQGSIEITEAMAPTKVAMKLDMVRPMEAHNVVEFTLDRGEGAGDTSVTWAMQGEQPFLGKVLSTFINCEKMVGSEFEKGLAKLKTLAEAAPAEEQAAR